MLQFCLLETKTIIMIIIMSTFPKPVACVYGHIYEILRAYTNTKERKLQNKWGNTFLE